jgi:acetolactate synthase-1/3 small subunit
MKELVTFLVWTENSPGVLLRLTTLFTRRKINVESLTVSVTEVAGISRFTIAIESDRVIAATIGRQIERMIDVRRVFVLTEDDIVHREVVLLRATLDDVTVGELSAQFSELRCLDRTDEGVLLQFTGDEKEIGRFLGQVEPQRISEFVRSGRIAVSRAGNYEMDLARSLHELRPEASAAPDM